MTRSCVCPRPLFPRRPFFLEFTLEPLLRVPRLIAGCALQDTARFEKLEKSKEAADLLFENPDMKAIHSTQSARQLLESASGKDKEETKAK